ncbi:hypothetical protein [Streptomyces sp. NPDC087294]|uniref:hypothetical protein n=1 Tax=Streptomyces sp. NPDC087294 TaxID=3365777 RepID=UPI00380B7482
MLTLRLTRAAHPAVHLRRALVTAASAGTGFLLLCTLGYALSHPDDASTAALLRLAWCLTPLAATVYLAVAVARTDPGTRPKPGLAAIGLGPGRLMAVSAVTTALSCALGSLLALLVFLHLRGDLTGTPSNGTAQQFLAVGRSLPLPGALTLLALVPVSASLTVALLLPRRGRPLAAGRAFGRFGAYGRPDVRESFGAYGRFGARRRGPRADEAPDGTAPAGQADGPHDPADPRSAQAGLPWGITTLAAGLAVESYAGRAADGSALPLPGGLAGGAPAVLLGWMLTAVGLALAGPGLTQLCGRLLQTARPGAMRLLAGRVLMAEAHRIGRPLGVVCAVASGAWAMTVLYDPAKPAFGPLTVLGALLVTGCAVATLGTAAVEARQSRVGTTAALVRLGAPTATLRGAAAVRAGALLALFGPLTLIVAELAALPLAS